MARQEYAGAAARTKLSAGIASGASSFTVLDATGWPTGATGPFVVTVGRGTATREKILCSSRSGTTITVASGGRGHDGTTAQAHETGDDVEHTISAAKLDELDDHMFDVTRDDHTQYFNGARHDARDHSAALATAALGDLGDVAATAPSSGQALVWDGTQWAPAAVGSAADTAVVAAGESTASGPYTDLTTPGPAVTVTVGASGRVLVTMSAFVLSGSGGSASMGFAVSGASTVAASFTEYLLNTTNTSGEFLTGSWIVEGLTPGSTTFTAKYAGGGASASFTTRRIGVVAL